MLAADPDQRAREPNTKGIPISRPESHSLATPIGGLASLLLVVEALRWWWCCGGEGVVVVVRVLRWCFGGGGGGGVRDGKDWILTCFKQSFLFW